MGCGRVGASIAVRLVEEGWFINIMDINPVTFDRLPESLIADGFIVPIIGDGTLERDLRKAGARDAEIFIALSGRDTRNAMAAQIAQRILEVPLVICRMNDLTRRDMYDALGLIAITPIGIISDMIIEATHR